MDIFEFGMQMEKDGEKFYRELAQKCGDKGLENILNMLADSEVTHYKVLKEMKEKTDPALAQAPTLKDVKNVFAGMGEGQKDFSFDMAQVDLYKKAQDLEKQSEDFYRDKASEVQNDVQKEIFMKIAVEEKDHWLILDKVIDFVSRPEQWLENAEWNQLGGY